MNSLFYKSWLVACAAALVTACGGGGGGSAGGAGTGGAGAGEQPPVRTESPFASASMFVPTGQASKSFALEGCIRSAGSGNTPITSATVVISSNGDMVFSGALGTASVAELGRINFADANERDVYGQADTSPYFEVDYGAADGRDMYLWNNSGFFSRPASGAGFNHDDCSIGPTTATMTLEQPLSQARVVSNIVTGSTGTVDISASVSGGYTQTGSIVSWDSGVSATFARFISFNLATAQFGQGSSLDPSTHTPVAFALPTPGSNVRSYYEEYLDTNGNKTIYFTHGNIEVRYRRYADPASNSGNGRQFRFYDFGV
jgi:hypothetical protein